MPALSTYDKERTYFHLGYGSRVGIDAGDIGRLEEAVNTIWSDYMVGQVIKLLNVADETYRQLHLVDNDWFDAKEIHAGDLNRSSRRVEPQKQQRIWQAEYERVTTELAKLLRVTNYSSPDSWQWTYDRAGSVQAIPGIADTSVSSRTLEFNTLVSGMGD